MLVDRSKNAWFLVGCYALGLAAQLSVGLRGLSNRPSNWYTSPWWVLRNYVTNFCMCVLFARTARGPNPLVARLAAEVVALRQPATHHPGLHRFFQGATWLWAGIFLLLTAGLAVLMVTEPTKTFLMLSTATTAALVIAGTGASTLWFLSVLRRLGLRLRFAPARARLPPPAAPQYERPSLSGTAIKMVTHAAREEQG